MYSLATRINSIFFHWLCTLATLAALCHISGRFVTFQPQIDADFKVVKYPHFLHRTKAHYYKPNWDYCSVEFSLDIKGLHTFDNWNLKQAFLYIEARFDGENGRNIQIIWDKIISRQEISKMKRFRKKKMLTKYAIRDLYRTLRGRKVQISLWAEFMPNFGVITRNKYYETEITIPSEYTHSNR